MASESIYDQEIAHFTETKITQLRKSRNVGNWIGLLMTAVPESFVPPAHELRRYRERKQREAEEYRKRWVAILEDPNSTDEHRQ